MSTSEEKCYYPLILTGTINPAVFSNNNVVLTDAEERLSQYCETLTRFLSDSPFDPIIFAENSGYPFPTEEFCALAKQNGKRFEYLYVETSVEKTAAFGKSYGEAVLISQALQNSKLLRGQEIIYKITGRVYLENADKICQTADSGKSEFLTIRHRCACQTVFFKLLRRDFENGLLNLPDYCNEASGLDVEHAIYNLLHEKKISYGCFCVYPRLHGICGTSGILYDKSAKNLMIKDQMIRMGMFKDGKLNSMQQLLHRFLVRYRENYFW